MIKQFFNRRMVYLPLILLLIGGMGIVIFPQEIPLFEKISEFALPVIFIYLGTGFFFFITGNARLVIISFLCAASISLFIKNFSNTNLNFPAKRGFSAISVANVNLINFQGDMDSFFQKILKIDADILCFHEVNPGWDGLLTDRLKGDYPHVAKLVRIDAFGKMVFSKSASKRIDTLYYNDIPDMDITFEIDGQLMHLVCSQIIPPFNPFIGSNSKEHLMSLANYVNSLDLPVLLTGEFNQVYWSQEMRNFLNHTKLENSRKSLSMLTKAVPYEHIFFSRELECTGLTELSDYLNNHLGILGEYQIKTEFSLFYSGNSD